jgi:hypothetical protein
VVERERERERERFLGENISLKIYFDCSARFSLTRGWFPDTMKLASDDRRSEFPDTMIAIMPVARARRFATQPTVDADKNVLNVTHFL